SLTVLNASGGLLYLIWQGWLFVDHNASAANRCRRITVVGRAHLVVVDDPACGFVPDFDSELVHATAAVDLPVNGRQHEAVVAASIDCPGAFVLSLCPGNHQPLIVRAVKVQVPGLEVELRLAGGDRGTLL